MSWARNSVGERGDNIGLPDVTTADNGKIMEVEAGEWKLKEGSGGGLPDVTSADIGKILGVVNDTEKPVYSYIVPEQKITTDGDGGSVLSDVASSLVAEGKVCSVIINDTEYTETIDGDWYLILPGDITFDFNQNIVLNLSPNTEYTVSVATAVGYEPKTEWVAGGSGGGGLVVTSSYDELTEQETLSVTAQEIITAMQTGPVILCITNILDSDPPTEYMFNLLTVYNNSNEPYEYAHTFNFGDAMYYANSLSEHPQYPGPALPD